MELSCPGEVKVHAESLKICSAGKSVPRYRHIYKRSSIQIFALLLQPERDYQRIPAMRIMQSIMRACESPRGPLTVVAVLPFAFALHAATKTLGGSFAG